MKIFILIILVLEISFLAAGVLSASPRQSGGAVLAEIPNLSRTRVDPDGGMVYTPGKDPGPITSFADMDGGGDEEAVILFQTQPRDGQGRGHSFAYVYEINGKNHLRDRPLGVSLDE